MKISLEFCDNNYVVKLSSESKGEDAILEILNDYDYTNIDGCFKTMADYSKRYHVDFQPIKQHIDILNALAELMGYTIKKKSKKQLQEKR